MGISGPGTSALHGLTRLPLVPPMRRLMFDCTADTMSVRFVCIAGHHGLMNREFSRDVSTREEFSMLFDSNVERSEGSALARESNYDYLRRSNCPQAIEICHWMNEWFRELPPTRCHK